jgi:hypothetical protein
VDHERNDPLGEDQTGASAAAGTSGGAEAADTSNDKPASVEHSTPATTGAGKPDRDERPRAGSVTIMAPARRDDWFRHWDDEIEVEAPEEASQSAAGRLGLRKLAAVAAAVILAAIAGAFGGALATAGLSHRGDAGTAAAVSETKALDGQMAQIQTELAALKASVEHATKLSAAQIGKTTDRVEKLEKAQAEPAAKIAKLTETVDRLRTAQAQPAAPAPAPTTVASAAPADVTGSIAPKPEAAKPQPGRLPTVAGWVLRDVYDGGAVIEGRGVTYEVYTGDPVPGLGRVDAIRRQEGRWVVVTSRGLIVAR